MFQEAWNHPDEKQKETMESINLFGVLSNVEERSLEKVRRNKLPTQCEKGSWYEIGLQEKEKWHLSIKACCKRI